MRSHGPAALAHIPGAPAWPIVGHTLEIARDAYGRYERSVADFGQVYKFHFLGRWRVALAGPDALELVLMDRKQNFSSVGGWESLVNLFPGGLMLRDFDDHRQHRRLMQTAFRKPVMDSYQRTMGTAIDDLVANWSPGSAFDFCPAIKTLTLRMGAAVFMGLPLNDPRVDRLNAAFVAEVKGSMGVVRRPLPGTAMGRGAAARSYLVQTIAAMIPERQSSDAPGEDFFTQMCRARDEDGTAWTAPEIADHFNFLLMAAHDTTASALTTMLWALLVHPDWMARIEAEVAALPPGPPDEAALAGMEMTDRLLKEALRLVPPVPFIPRRAVRAFEWCGLAVPAGTYISVSPGMVQMDPTLWTGPERFDPDRFSPNRAEDRSHRFAYAPFGGGAHKCIGMHFSALQVKTFVAALLRRHRIAAGGTMPQIWARLPIPQPRGGLPVILHPRQTASAAA